MTTDPRVTAASLRPHVLIIAEPGMIADAARHATALVGASVVASTGWQGAPQAIAPLPTVDLVIVAAQGASDAQLEAILPQLDTLAQSMPARIVVAMAEAQIDLVASLLWGRHVDLLCEPTIAQWVAAIGVAIAPLRRDRLRDPAREEDERLHRLREELTRIVDLLSRLAADDASQDNVADRSLSYAGPPATSSVTGGDIRKIIRARRLRDAQFSPGLFEDPAWDMLLDLYAAHLEGVRVSVSSLCIAAAVAPTTALRWIARLSDSGLLERHPDPSDRRRAYLALSDTARDRMTRYFAALAQNGLPIA
ncbi:MAG: MarR family winged helix-turn-helix transcriptional regulator [Pseudomonadota bacterium]